MGNPLEHGSGDELSDDVGLLESEALDEVNGAGLEITGIKLPDPNRPKTEQDAIEALKRGAFRQY